MPLNFKISKMIHFARTFTSFKITCLNALIISINSIRLYRYNCMNKVYSILFSSSTYLPIFIQAIRNHIEIYLIFS
jgi:hypothetical protein